MNDRRRQPEPNTSASAGASAWLALVVLAAAAWAVYGRSLDAPFIFDDDVSVLINGSIRSLWPLVGVGDERGPLNPPIDIPTSARPLVNLSLALNYLFGGVDPRGYRAVNIVLHVLSAMLLWAIVRRTLRLPYFDKRLQWAAGPLALAVALSRAGHSPRAIEHFRAALQLQPGFEEARDALGMALAAGRLEAAIAEFEKTLE